MELNGLEGEQAWIATVTGLVVALVIGALAFPARVYDGFIWQYFWGPVVADAHGATCAAREAGETTILYSTTDCTATEAIVAYPGYTTVSTVSYALVLLLALVGIIYLLRRLQVGTSQGFFFALFPFMLFGGALRTVEDANVALIEEGVAVIPFPWSGLIISPLIYITVFFIVLGALLLSVGLERRELVERYEYPLAAMGTVALVATIAGLGWLSVTTDELGFFPIVPIVTLGGATVLTAITWVLIERYAPSVNAGTGYMGALVIWGHTVDGIANVLSLDWAGALGLPTYTPKHVVNAWIVDTTGSLQPAWLSELIGTAWPFLFVKIAVAAIVVWVFEEEMMEESPQYSMLLLVAVLAVGLGPGTRDFLRATFGI